MKVVHINRFKIKQDGERAALVKTLTAKWERMSRERIRKKYAGLLEHRRT